MAQERYGFFNSTAEDERSYDSADMAAALGTLASSGVAKLDGCLQVTAEGSTMRTLAGYGTAMLQGYYYQLKDDGGGVQAFSHTTEAGLNRIDRIVVRLDLASRTIGLKKLIGTAASTAQPPQLTRDGEIFEISLAQVLVRAGAQEILTSDIADERGDDAVCGLIAPESLRRNDVLQAIDDRIGDDTREMLRCLPQTLTAEQQAQSRLNIGAQAAIAAAGLLKGNGSAVSAAAAGTDYALPGSEVLATLTAAGWAGTQAPYTQTVAAPGMTAAKRAVAGLSHTATRAQYLAALGALLRVTAQGAGTLTVTAEGEKPAADLPILIEMAG